MVEEIWKGSIRIWIVRTVPEKGLEQQLKTPATTQTKKKHTHTQQQQSHGRKRKNKNKQLLNLEKKQQQERRSNLSPQKLRAAKFNAKKQHAQKPDT